MPTMTVRLMEVIQGQSKHVERKEWSNVSDDVSLIETNLPCGTSENHQSWYVTCTHDNRGGWQDPPTGTVRRIHIENIMQG